MIRSLAGEPVAAARRKAKRRAEPPKVEEVLLKRRLRQTGDRTVRKPLSRLRKPEDMSLEAWQVELRRQFGRQQNFRIKNIGKDPLFSEFEVTNPQTKRTYRVAIRGAALGENYCSCPDFAVNTLGTCKHIEFTLARLGRTRAAQKALAFGFHPPYAEIYLQYGAQRMVVFRPGSECPAQLKALAAKYFDDQGRLRPEGFAQFHVFLHKALGGKHEVRCYQDALTFVAQVRDQAALQEQIERAFPRGGRGAAFRKLLKAPMYPYQREGALLAARAGRCLIADDMGLGKTIEAIAAVEILARTAGVERVLIIAPTSLKHQWKQEIARFSQRPALVVEGLLPRRAAAYAAESFYKITNYDVICRDLEAIRRWQPEVIILDEAQRIKNWQTRTAQSVKQLESKFALVLTGTPLENRLEELHSIVEFVDRFRLGPMFRFLHEHQHVDEHGRVVGYRNLSNISQTLKPILIRRTKDEVLPQLPERLEKRFFVPMTDQQAKHHEENRQIVAQLVQKWRRWGFLSESDQLRLRIALQNMRMSCNSTYLLDKKTDYGVKADELTELLGEIFEDPQAKVVIFSQWLRMQELVVRRLERRKWDHVLFHGGVPGPQRKGLIQRFREDARCRLFLSTDAGGVGLNLQHASAVVILDQPWNPAVLEQRIGRVHRLGQQRPVRVVHFISQGTIEEGMLGLLAFKKSLFAGVLDDGEDEVFLGGTRLNRFMESVEKATTAIPAAAPSPPRIEAPRVEPARIAGPERPAGAKPSKPAAPPSAPQEQLWTDVLTAGMSLLEKLGQAFTATQAGPREPASARAPGGAPPALPGALVARDESTGQSFLRLPMPAPETMQQILALLAGLAGNR